MSTTYSAKLFLLDLIDRPMYLMESKKCLKLNWIIQGDWKVTQPISDTCSICQKINDAEIREQKNNVIKVLEMSTAFSDARIHSFPHVWRNPAKSFCATETEHQTTYYRMREWEGEWTLVALVKNTCTSTVWRQMTDWSEQVTTWRASDIELFVNPTVLYWIATINKYFDMGCVTFRSPCISTLSCIFELVNARCFRCRKLISELGPRLGHQPSSAHRTNMELQLRNIPMSLPTRPIITLSTNPRMKCTGRSPCILGPKEEQSWITLT
jgi:hypothetical protein